jgi:hypothetical protein
MFPVHVLEYASQMKKAIALAACVRVMKDNIGKHLIATKNKK